MRFVETMANPHSKFDALISQLADDFEAIAKAMLSVILSFVGGSAKFDEASAAVDEAGGALEESAAQWVEDNLPVIYADGVQEALGSPETPDVNPQSLAHDVHDETLALFQDELVSELGAATQRMTDDAKMSLREIARRRLAASLDNGTNARDEARRMDAEMREKGVNVVDRSGRKWDSRAYATMVLRTHTVAVSNEGNLNTAAELGSPGVRVRDGGPGDVDEPCRVADGQVWGLEYARAHKLEHPNCRRAFSALPSTFDGELQDGQEHPPEPTGIDPHGDGVKYAPSLGAIFIEEPPTPEPSGRDINALKKAYPDAEFVLWGEKDVRLKEQAAPQPTQSDSGVDISAIQKRLNDLGISDVTLGSDATAAEMVTTGLERVAARGIAMPDEVVVDSAPFEKDYGSMASQVPARALNGRDRSVLQFNPLAEGYRSEDVAQRKANEQREEGFWASDDLLHPIYHEAGHAAHYKAFPSLYQEYSDTPQGFVADRLKQVGASVSRYAQTNAREFVAEVFAGMVAGQEYGPDVMKTYNMLGGPTP